MLNKHVYNLLYNLNQISLKLCNVTTKYTYPPRKAMLLLGGIVCHTCGELILEKAFAVEG